MSAWKSPTAATRMQTAPIPLVHSIASANWVTVVMALAVVVSSMRLTMPTNILQKPLSVCYTCSKHDPHDPL